MTKRKYKPTSKICSLADFEKSDATWFEVGFQDGYELALADIRGDNND